MRKPYSPAHYKDGTLELLTGGFFGADNGYLYLLPALGAGDIHGDRLFHYSFGNYRNNRIHVIQTSVEHVQPLRQTLDILGDIAAFCPGSFTLGQFTNLR